MRSSAVRQLHLGYIAGAYIIKKLAIYKAAKHYGFPRVYRRIIEGIRNTVPVENQASIRSKVRTAMRLPNKAYPLLKDSGMIDFVNKYSDLIVKNSPISVPPFMYDAATMVQKLSGFGWERFSALFKGAKK